MVSVAQLVESRIVIPVVAGSSPVVHPIYKLLINSLVYSLIWSLILKSVSVLLKKDKNRTRIGLE